jgi:hypothetical protein
MNALSFAERRMTKAFEMLKGPLTHRLPAETEWTIARSPTLFCGLDLRLRVFGYVDTYRIDLLVFANGIERFAEPLMQQSMEIQIARAEAAIRAAGLKVFEAMGSDSNLVNVLEFRNR